MNKIFSLILFSAITSSNVIAQNINASQICAEGKINTHLQQYKTAVESLVENDYDVRYVKFNLSLDNQSTFIAGDVTTTAKVVAPQMSVFAFELTPQLTIDSLKINGQNLNVTTANNLRTATLPIPLNQNVVFTVQVFYHGQPVNGTGFFSSGIRNDQSPSWGADVTYTMSQPYASKDWWPCKQALKDKIDSADIWITVPSYLKAGSNGVLQNVTSLPGNLSRYEWKTRYPIDYYLLSLSVAPYVDYTYYAHFSGSNDSVKVQNYVYNNPQTLPFWKDEIDSVGLMITYLSDLFGRYPFWQEKYGHCMAPLGGGMEHQTMTTQGTFNTTLSVHELAHQWFGDNATCATWKDIWLNEGFASYAEYLYVHHFWGANKGFNYMKDKHDEVLQQTDGSVYVDDTTNVGRIFDGRLTYDKGASIVHTLRFVTNNDVQFFQLLKDYQQQFAFKTATTDDFKNFAEQELSQDLDTFFNQWIYGEGAPAYAATWNQIGNTMYVKLNQSSSEPVSNPLYSTPVELKFTSSQGDTVVRIYNNQSIQTYSFVWNKTMTGLVIDPNDWLVNFNFGTSKDVTLNVEEISKSNILVYPNPTTDHWVIKNLPEEASLHLFDMNGSMILKEKANAGSHSISSGSLPSGIYFLKIQDKNSSYSLKLIKQ